MFDIRYHIASLVAVFLALSLGILLGTVIVEKGIIVQQVQKQVENLEKKYDEIRAENKDLKSQAELANLFQKEVYNSLAEGKLANRKVAVIFTSSNTLKTKQDVLKSLSDAGAKPVSVILRAPSFKLEDEKVKAKLLSFFPEGELSDEEFKTKVIAKWVSELVTPSDGAFVRELNNLNIIELSGLENLPVDSVVVLDGSPTVSVFKDVNFPYINQLKDLGILVVGAELTSIEVSYISEYQKLGLSTVDNVDNLIGRLSLIYVLSGKSGSFGQKQTAQSLSPPLN